VAQVLRFSGVALSHAGLVRPDNEDSGFLGPSCMLVADGVGGSAAGEVASATATYVLSALATHTSSAGRAIVSSGSGSPVRSCHHTPRSTTRCSPWFRKVSWPS